MIFACIVAREEWAPNARPIDHRDRWGVTGIELNDWAAMNDRQSSIALIGDGLPADVLAKLKEISNGTS